MIRDVMSNGGMSSIKKQIFLSLGLFFSCSNLGAMCPQTVGTISINEGIWSLLSRVGEAQNVIQSQICAFAFDCDMCPDFDCSTTSTCNCSCIPFGQSDIGAGNVYTISSPGVYCMIENVTFSFGTAITVNSSDVTINLKGHTLNGGNGALSVAGIRLENFISNVTIQNGTIENISGSTFFAIRDSGVAASIFDAALSNIVIKDINFNNNFSSIGLGVVPAEQVFLDGILIENCNFFGTLAPDIQLLSISSIVRNCQLQNSFEILSPGVPAGTRYALVEDCVVSSTSSVQVGIISVAADNVVVRNCILQGPANQGINVAGTNVTISDCTLQDGDTSNPIYGLNLTNNGGAALIERCFVANNATGFYITNAGNSLKLVDCVAESNAFNGFYFNTPVSKITVQGCSAEANGINGFVIQNNGTGQVISKITFENCVAQGNSGDGFSLVNADPGSAISEVIFMNCVSQRNLGGTDGVTTWFGDGFGIGSASTNAGPIFDVLCQNCVAQRNVHDGLNFASTVTLGKILDNCSMFNTGTGFANLTGSSNAFVGNVSLFNVAADYSGLAVSDSIQSRAAGLGKIAAYENVSS